MILIRVCRLFSFFYSLITRTTSLDLVDAKFSVNQCISKYTVRVRRGVLCVDNQSSDVYQEVDLRERLLLKILFV